MKVANRDAVIYMPLWASWLVKLWWHRYRLTFGTLKRLGFWRLLDGDRWMDGWLSAPRWLQHAWWYVRSIAHCFLVDSDHIGHQRFSDTPQPGRPFYGLTPREYTDARDRRFTQLALVRAYLAEYPNGWGLSRTTYPNWES